jgi:8-oxo-dGTP diphosphatase
VTAPQPAHGPTARSLLAAGALFVDDQQRLLLVKPTYKDHWEIPGGYVEAGEAPRDACRRELKEELGLDVSVGELISVDWAPHPRDGDKVLFIFDGGDLQSEHLDKVRFADGEISDYSFVSAADLDAYTVPRLSRRLRATLTARQAGRLVYLENGQHVT